ncbi:MAG: hypothetical protein ACK4G3_07655 [bacterium]
MKGWVGRLFIFSSCVWLFLAVAINLGSRWSLVEKGQPWYFSFTILSFSFLLLGWLFQFLFAIVLLNNFHSKRLLWLEIACWVFLQLGLVGEMLSIPGGLPLFFAEPYGRNIVYFLSGILQALALFTLTGYMLFYFITGRRGKAGDNVNEGQNEVRRDAH